MSIWFNVYVLGDAEDFEGCEESVGGWFLVYRCNRRNDAVAYYRQMVAEYGEDLVFFEED